MAIRGKMLAPLCIGLTLCGVVQEVQARVKLITQPVRERVELRLDGGQGTFVEEERWVPLQAGVNSVDFSWHGLSLDPASLIFTIDGSGPIALLSTDYPPNESAVTWQVAANEAGTARVRIGYLLAHVTPSYYYRAVTNPEETRLDLGLMLEVENLTAESFGPLTLHSFYGPPLDSHLEREENKRLLLRQIHDVAIERRYRVGSASPGYLDQPQGKLKVALDFVMANRPEQGLGGVALPQGKVRVYHGDAKGGEAFLGEAFTPRLAADAPLRLDLGVARDLEVVRRVERRERRRIAGDLYAIDLTLLYEIENFRDSDATIELHESMALLLNELGVYAGRAPEWRFDADSDLQRAQLDPELGDNDEPVFLIPVHGRGKQQVRLRLTLNNLW